MPSNNNNNGKYLHRNIPPVGCCGHSKVKSGDNNSVPLIILVRTVFVLLRLHPIVNMKSPVRAGERPGRKKLISRRLNDLTLVAVKFHAG